MQFSNSRVTIICNVYSQIYVLIVGIGNKWYNIKNTYNLKNTDEKSVLYHMSSLFTNKQQKMANKYSKTRAKVEEQGKDFANEISNSLTPETVKSSFVLINNKGHDHEKKPISRIESKYNSGHALSAEEWIQFNDIFAAITNRLGDTNDE